MASPKVPKDKFFEKVINPYLAGVLQHPQSIEMHEGVLHIRDVEGPKKTGSMEARLEAMEQQVFKCQGMVERGLNANHMMITEFTNKHKIDANDIGKHLSRLYDRIDHLQAQIYDLQNQNCEVDEVEKTARPETALGRLKAVDERLRQRGQACNERADGQLMYTEAQWRAWEEQERGARNNDDGQSMASDSSGNHRWHCYKCDKRDQFKRDCPEWRRELVAERALLADIGVEDGGLF
ncbi:40S ribosomal protein S5-1 [Hordeum vulgare]|nr:40S ribosomal protein S5-1 [Hordeum vulgare]